MSMRNRSMQGILLALFSSMAFGLIPFFSLPLIRAGIDVSSILFYRLLGASIFLTVIGLIRGVSFRMSLRDGSIIMVLGLLSALSSFGLLASYQYIASGLATTIHFLYPLLVTGLMIAFFHEHRSSVLLLSGFVSTIGVGLMSFNDSVSGSSGTTGILIVLMTVVTFGVYMVMLKKSGLTMGTIPLTCYLQGAGALIFGLIAYATTGIQPIGELPMTLLVDIGLLALIPTVFAHLTLLMAVRRVGPSVTSILGSLEPVTAVFVGIFYFHEPVGLKYFFGLILILGSVVAVIWSTRHPKNV